MKEKCLFKEVCNNGENLCPEQGVCDGLLEVPEQTEEPGETLDKGVVTQLQRQMFKEEKHD